MNYPRSFTIPGPGRNVSIGQNRKFTKLTPEQGTAGTGERTCPRIRSRAALSLACVKTEPIPLGNLTHFGFAHAARGESRCPDAMPDGRAEGGIEGNFVLVDGDAGMIERFLGEFAGQASGSDVHQQEMVVGAAGNNAEAKTLELMGKVLALAIVCAAYV